MASLRERGVRCSTYSSFIQVMEQAICPMGDRMRREIGWILSGAGADTYAIDLAEGSEMPPFHDRIRPDTGVYLSEETRTR